MRFAIHYSDIDRDAKPDHPVECGKRVALDAITDDPWAVTCQACRRSYGVAAAERLTMVRVALLHDETGRQVGGGMGAKPTGFSRQLAADYAAKCRTSGLVRTGTGWAVVLKDDHTGTVLSRAAI